METRTGKRHSTDLTDAQWAELEGFLDLPRDPSRGGQPQQYPRRRIAGTVFYQLRTGVQWHLLPGDFPPWTAAWQQYCRWRDSGVWLPIMSICWVAAATILVAAIALKASDDFIWVMYVLLAGFGLSCAVIEAARRRFFRM